MTDGLSFFVWPSLRSPAGWSIVKRRRKWSEADERTNEGRKEGNDVASLSLSFSLSFGCIQTLTLPVEVSVGPLPLHPFLRMRFGAFLSLIPFSYGRKNLAEMNVDAISHSARSAVSRLTQRPNVTNICERKSLHAESRSFGQANIWLFGRQTNNATSQQKEMTSQRRRISSTNVTSPWSSSFSLRG